MSIDQSEPEQDGDVVLPPVQLDPVFAEALDDALSGLQPPTSPLDPNRVLGADPHDFAGLYLRHHGSFGLHARRYLRDPRDVDEVVQEAFLRLFLAMPELASELQALAYCRRTITNLCIDRYRADQRRPRLVDIESVPVDVLSDDQPADPVVQAEDAAIVREALALLSPLHREALVKREIEEKPLPQIASELGVPEENVKHLLHRARRALRRRLVDAHATRGTDLDDVSALSLLARSAVAGTGRVGVLVLLFLGLVAGASTTTVPVQAYETISGLWTPDDPPASAASSAPSPGETAVVGQVPGVLGADRDYPGSYVKPPLPAEPGEPAAPQAPPVVAVPDPAPAATGTVDAGGTPSVVAAAPPAPARSHPTVVAATPEFDSGPLPTLPLEPRTEQSEQPSGQAGPAPTASSTSSPPTVPPTPDQVVGELSASSSATTGSAPSRCEDRPACTKRGPRVLRP